MMMLMIHGQKRSEHRNEQDSVAPVFFAWIAACLLMWWIKRKIMGAQNPNNSQSSCNNYQQGCCVSLKDFLHLNTVEHEAIKSAPTTREVMLLRFRGASKPKEKKVLAS
jgi:hypothetical protein